MCDTCISRERRRFLFLAGLGITAAVGMAVGAAPARAAGHDGPRSTMTPDQALNALKEGNRRYVESPQTCTADLAKARESVAQSQAPWAVVVGCSDSRVPPELLFGGLGLGQLFVARNAGNLVDTATLGTVEYGTSQLGAPLVVVLGHERCGAVAAACDDATKHTKLPGAIGPMVEPIVPVALAMKDKPGDFIDNTVRESARRTAALLAKNSTILSGLVAEGHLKIVAARYDLDDGTVEYLAA